MGITINSALLETLSQEFGPTEVEAGQFFLAWNSVVTLAYQGFSSILQCLKKRLAEELEKDGVLLQPENPGSLWPKTTLGCLREGQELTPAETKQMRELCTEFNEQLNSLPSANRTMSITELRLVVFECRTLENRLLEVPFSLQGQSKTPDSPEGDHVKKVRETMDQFAAERLDEYYIRLASGGRTIDTYYRCTHPETTLIAKAAWPKALSRLVDAFIWKVDSEDGVPKRFAWFDPGSRHMTVRALVPR
jgi:hypothetical protein